MPYHMFNPTLMERDIPTADVCHDTLSAKLSDHGFCCLGLFHPTEQSRVPALKTGKSPKSIILVGNAGDAMWRIFRNERQDEPDPLDHWVQRVLTRIATEIGFEVVFPTEGPPYHPFHAWSEEANASFRTPGLPNIHPLYGTWFGLRAAFLSATPLPDTLLATISENPCKRCINKPCLQACPCGALNAEGYNIAACMDYIRSSIGHRCLKNGCYSRHICPVGQDYAYPQDQAEFHMRGCLDLYNTVISIP